MELVDIQRSSRRAQWAAVVGFENLRLSVTLRLFDIRLAWTQLRHPAH